MGPTQTLVSRAKKLDRLLQKYRRPFRRGSIGGSSSGGSRLSAGCCNLHLAAIFVREKPLIESAHVAGFISPPRRVSSFDTHNDNKFPSSFITRLTVHGPLALLQLWGSSCRWLRFGAGMRSPPLFSRASVTQRRYKGGSVENRAFRTTGPCAVATATESPKQL